MRRAVWVVRRSIILAIVASALPSVAAGQSGSATLAGTVRDGSGSGLAGVLVVLRNPETGAVQHATTGDAGAFEFAALVPASTVALERAAPASERRDG